MDKDIRTPLVSIIVRSMGRPELRLALESIAAQDYPRVEVILVDASGGTHPPLPDIRWRPGHVLRKVGGDHRLPRPV
ncbi:MAG: glycosyltransferase, partial [Thiobacillus sp.]|nr:glycosyltransferase [Thiobacillus sp.]